LVNSSQNKNGGGMENAITKEKMELIDKYIKEYLMSLNRDSFHMGPVLPGSYLRTSNALKEIRENKLYELRGENDFYIYCARKFGLRPNRVDEYLNYQEVASGTLPSPIQKPETSKPSYVYFIDAGNLIKIGVTKDVGKRLAALKTGSPVQLAILGFIPGTKQKEKELHHRFSSYRTHGEWFEKNDDLINYIKEVCNG